jgi:hypothetical protein
MQPNTNTHSVSMPFTFDGRSVSSSNVTLTVSECLVEGVDFWIPKQYGLLLLREKTALEAQTLLKELLMAPFTGEIKRQLVIQACDCGFESANVRLKQYKQHLPTSTPAFYVAEKNLHQKWYSWDVFLVTDKASICFNVSENLRTTIAHLPQDVYIHRFQYGSFDLDLAQYQKLAGRETEFFDFVENLCQCMEYIRGDACRACYSLYFENVERAETMLGELCSRVGSRGRRDELFRTFMDKGFLEFAGGLFVRSVGSNYFISNNGEVHKLQYGKKAAEREAVLRAYEKGKLPTKLVPVEGNSILRSVAEVVSKVRSELALVILP